MEISDSSPNPLADRLLHPIRTCLQASVPGPFVLRLIDAGHSLVIHLCTVLVKLTIATDPRPLLTHLFQDALCAAHKMNPVEDEIHGAKMGPNRQRGCSSTSK
jgi:hypothetical protein